jgi:hypothetical protein
LAQQVASHDQNVAGEKLGSQTIIHLTSDTLT